jgi:hypothetical protein
VSRYNALCAAGALVVASVVWYPDLLAPAAAVAALVAVCATALPRHRAYTPPTITRMPTAYERGHSRWVPGAGLGFSLFHWPPRPFLFLTFWRWRR